MSTFERAGSLFCLLISGLVLYEALRLGVGKPSEPGMGFMAAGASAILGLLSLFRLFVPGAGMEGDDEGIFPVGFYRRALPAFGLLIVYALALPHAGYVVATFILMLLLFRLANPSGRWSVLAAAFASTAGSFVLFQYLLGNQFPAGPLGF